MVLLGHVESDFRATSDDDEMKKKIRSQPNNVQKNGELLLWLMILLFHGFVVIRALLIEIYAPVIYIRVHI